MAGPDEGADHRGGQAVGRRGVAVGGNDLGGIGEHHEPFTARGTVVGDRLDRSAAQLRSQALGLSDRGRGEHEGGVGSVEGAHAAQAAQHVRDVTAEHAPQHVKLIHHHVAEPHQEGVPAAVVGKQAVMEHLRVGEDHVRVAPSPGPGIRRRVAVVGGGDQTGCVEVAERAELILGERLGGEEDESCARPDRIGHGLGDGQLVAERLSRRRAGGDDDAALGAHGVDGLGLMGPETLVAQLVEPLGQSWGQGPGEWCVRGSTGGQQFGVDQALAQQLAQRVPGAGEGIGVVGEGG